MTTSKNLTTIAGIQRCGPVNQVRFETQSNVPEPKTQWAGGGYPVAETLSTASLEKTIQRLHEMILDSVVLVSHSPALADPIQAHTNKCITYQNNQQDLVRAGWVILAKTGAQQSVRGAKILTAKEMYDFTAELELKHFGKD